MSEWVRAVREDAGAWCEGRSWLLRAPLLAWGAWILVHHLRDADYASLFAGLNLGIHELGHVVLGPFGLVLSVLGGSLAQLLAPLASVAIFLRQRDWFGICFCFLWLGASLFELARYVGDARAMELPLVSPFGGDPIHDWNFLLGRAGLLRWDASFARLLRLCATCSILAFLAGGGWLLHRMWRSRRGPESAESS
ncbi:MAG TPA: hypothetical protein VGD74_12650 [Vulgatibacter sp.]